MCAEILEFPEQTNKTNNDIVTDNCVIPFMVDGSGLHGRFVRLGSVIDDIISRHDVDDVVRALLGEFIVMGAGMATSLKYDGIFTLQTSSDGPVPMMVADLTTDGKLRGYAQVKGDVPTKDEAKLSSLLGKGYAAFTVDQGKDMERYQGIIELFGDTLSETLKHYYEQSQQIAGTFRIACAKTENGWRAGAVLVQRLAVEEDKRDVNLEEENWRRCSAFVESLTDEELVGVDATADKVLFNLFHEEGVRLYDPQPLVDECRCDTSRIRSSLSQMPEDDLKYSATDGVIEITCDFCQEKRQFDVDEFISS